MRDVTAGLLSAAEHEAMNEQLRKQAAHGAAHGGTTSTRKGHEQHHHFPRATPRGEDGLSFCSTVTDTSGIIKLGRTLVPLGGDVSMNPPTYAQNPLLAQVYAQRICQILDSIGHASAVAQGLKQPVTDGLKLRNAHEDQWVYLLVDSMVGYQGAVLGMLKVGRKHLFLYSETKQTFECTPLCVLDFFVHESHRRGGLGKRLFDHMLQDQKVRDPHTLAIDAPSASMCFFLKKHYALEHTIEQTNHYVIFHGFFEGLPRGGRGEETRKTRIYMGKLQHL